MSEDRVKLTIDGHSLEAPKGEMLIRVADAAGIYIPRFCYHPRLKVVANCRMCLVDVEGAPKPLPACATPISDGMTVQTRSPRALGAQRATMEFLLINHPLDCPICDQGGECELQDTSLGYGRGVSRFTERKRVVEDKDIGPLVYTDMTRCIQCTRCIRVLEEVAGRQELGAMGRGEHLEIGTYVARSIDSELSGNIIDVCPVGALNDRPFNMRARGWEMLAQASVSGHDCAGSNLYGHALRGRYLRAVPRENLAINDCWIADRDRYAHTGLYAPDRVQRPLVRRAGKLVEVDWEDAIAAAAPLLAEAGAELGALVSPSATLEEMYLAQKLVRALGSSDIDARLRQGDFRDDAGDPRFPSLGGPVVALEGCDAALVIGSWINKEVPIVGYRLRRAAAKGAAIMALNPRRYDFTIPLAAECIVHPDDLAAALAALAYSLARAKGLRPPQWLSHFGETKFDGIDEIAGRLASAENGQILLGHLAHRHPGFADLRRLALSVAEFAHATTGYLTEGANMAGAYLAGAVPHRGPGGVPVAAGSNARAMLENPRKSYLAIGTEPELDCWDGAAAGRALREAPVVALASFLGRGMREYADCVLPLAAHGETAGAFVSAAGDVQRFDAVSVPVGEARPGWKILRALGAALELGGFDFTTLAEIRGEVMSAVGHVALTPAYAGRWEPAPAQAQRPALRAVVASDPYAGEPLLRRARPLQATADAAACRLIHLHPADGDELGIAEGDLARVRGKDGTCEAVAAFDPGVARGSVWVPAASGLPMWEEVTLEAVPRAVEAGG